MTVTERPLNLAECDKALSATQKRLHSERAAKRTNTEEIRRLLTQRDRLLDTRLSMTGCDYT